MSNTRGRCTTCRTTSQYQPATKRGRPAVRPQFLPPPAHARLDHPSSRFLINGAARPIDWDRRASSWSTARVGVITAEMLRHMRQTRPRGHRDEPGLRPLPARVDHRPAPAGGDGGRPRTWTTILERFAPRQAPTTSSRGSPSAPSRPRSANGSCATRPPRSPPGAPSSSISSPPACSKTCNASLATCDASSSRSTCCRRICSSVRSGRPRRRGLRAEPPRTRAQSARAAPDGPPPPRAGHRGACGSPG